MFDFKITAKEKNAKIGILKLNHGIVKTPAFLPVGTKATVKTISPEELKEIGVQIIVNNTYHLHFSPGEDLIEKAGGVNKFMAWDRPIFTDSGGFQAYSLGLGTKLGASKFLYKTEEKNKTTQPNKKKSADIDKDGVIFRSIYDGKKEILTPEKSIAIQQKLGSDIILSLDECTPPNADYTYTKESMKLTHRWAKRSIDAKTSDQALYGIIQGGLFQDLREESTRFICSNLKKNNEKGFDGIAIGGAFGRDEMYETLDWIMPKIPNKIPVHLLGIGTVEDIFESVKRGVDTFDCVGPTRIARVGYAYVKPPEGNRKNKYRIRLIRSKYKDDFSPIDKNCTCKMCKTYTKAYINHLFRNKEMLAYRIVSYHNIHFFINLMREIRSAIEKKQFEKLFDDWMK